MNSIVDLIRDLSRNTHPMLTWYGPEGERVDLSGKTATNWIIKATNLLMMEASSEPDTRIRLDLPVHWRTLIWACASWATGAQVSVEEDSDADIIITATPHTAPASAEVIGVALPALARSVEGLPTGAIDGAADLMTQADQFMFPPQPFPVADTGLFSADGSPLSQQDLLTGQVPPAGRNLLIDEDLLPPLLPHPGNSAPTGTSASPARVLLTGTDVRRLLLAVPLLWSRGVGVVISANLVVAEAEGVTHIMDMDAIGELNTISSRDQPEY